MASIPKRGNGRTCSARRVLALAASMCAAVAPLRAQRTSTPVESAAERYELAAAYSRAHNGDAMLVIKGEHVVFEDYRHRVRPEEPHPLFSGTKSFSCVIAAAAAGDGLLELDEPVARTIPEWTSDPRKARITIRHLLSFTSGLAPGRRELRSAGGADLYARAVDLPSVAEPGERFEYGPSHLYVFGEVMRRKLAPGGEDPLAYLARRVFTPIGLRIGGWERDGAGHPALPSGASLSAAEWAKFGVLMRDRGQWKGRPVLADSLLAACTAPAEAYAPYGLGFWLNAQTSPDAAARGRARPRAVDGPMGAIYEDGPRDLFMAAGAWNQRLYVVPSKGYVIVRFGRRDVTWSDAEFLARILDGRAARRTTRTLVPEP